MLRALGLGDGGVLVMRRPARSPPAGTLPQLEVAAGAVTPDVQRTYEQLQQAVRREVRCRCTVLSRGLKQRPFGGLKRLCRGGVATAVDAGQLTQAHSREDTLLCCCRRRCRHSRTTAIRCIRCCAQHLLRYIAAALQARNRVVHAVHAPSQLLEQPATNVAAGEVAEEDESMEEVRKEKGWGACQIGAGAWGNCTAQHVQGRWASQAVLHLLAYAWYTPVCLVSFC